jgi:hypothetical protein
MWTRVCVCYQTFFGVKEIDSKIMGFENCKIIIYIYGRILAL